MRVPGAWRCNRCKLTLLRLLCLTIALSMQSGIGVEARSSRSHTRGATAGGSRPRADNHKGLLQVESHHHYHPDRPQQRPVSWDDGYFWLEEQHKKTLYFEVVAGLGNRVRALASAIVVAREFGVGIKALWRTEPVCESCGAGYAPFVGNWDELFSEPPLRQAWNFPGENPDHSDGGSHAPENCTINWVSSYDDLARVLTSGWQRVNGEEVVCARGTSWLTRRGEFDAAPFFSLLKPSATVKQLIDNYQTAVGWDKTQWVCTHVRRTDLTIFNATGPMNATQLIHMSQYINPLKSLLTLASVDRQTRIFIATDDPAAEKEITASFSEGIVMSYPKEAVTWTRATVQGTQAALVDVLLLASCPVLVGTFYSSYSETARLLGHGFYVQVGSELLNQSKMDKFQEVPREGER